MTDWLQNLDSEDILTKFNAFLIECGIDIDDSTYIIQKSTNNVILNIKNLLKKGNVMTLNQFKDTIYDIINSKDLFLKLIEPMKTHFDHYLFSTAKSLFQLLLMISEINSYLVNIIVEKACELCQTENETETDLTIKCLNQLKWCISMCNSNEILDKLLDLGYVSNIVVKRHIILMLPSVCYGKYNSILATKLYDWMTSDNSLIDCCLEAINHLDLDDTFRHDTELLIISLLDTAAMHTLPAMITFLMKCTDKNNISTFVDKVRMNISFDNLQTMFSSAIISTPIDDRNQKCTKDLIDSIKRNFQFNSNLQKMWLKSISTGLDKVRCQSFDLIVLTIVHDYNDKTGSVVSIFRSKIIKGLFTEVTVEELFKYHLSVVRPLYQTLLNIVNSTMSCGDSLCCEFVKQVYEHCFRNCHSGCTTIDMVNLLLIEITTRSQFSIDGKIELLQFLAEKFTDKLRQFYTVIAELLPLGCRFTNNQIHGIYRILGTLAICVDDNEQPGDIQENVTAVIRKQLNNQDLFVRRNGVIGAVTVMRQLVNSGDYNQSWSPGIWTKMVSSQTYSESDLVSINSDEPSLNIVTPILKSVIDTIDVQPQLSIVLFDELYRLIATDEMTAAQLDIRRIVTNHFRDKYVINIDKHTDTNHRNIFGLLGTEYCDVSVLLSQIKPSTFSVNVSVPALFRLLAMCEQKTQNSNLKEINAMLGCPIIIESDFKEAQFLELITIINWMIEIVNAFSRDSININEAIFRLTYVARLKKIVSLKIDFETGLSEQLKVVKLPPAQIIIGTTLLPVTDIKMLPGKRKLSKSDNQKSSSKKNRTDVVDEDVVAVEDLFDDDSDQTVAKCRMLRDNLGLCYRELDLSVFIIMTNFVSVDMKLTNNGEAFVEWLDLEYYLGDLWLKTKQRLKPTMGVESALGHKSSNMYRYFEWIPLEDFLNQIVKVGSLFMKVLSSCINLCSHQDDFDDISGPCVRVMDVVLKTVSHVFNFLANHHSDDCLLRTFMSSLISNSSDVITDDGTELLRLLLTVRDFLPNIIIASSYLTLFSHLLHYLTPREVSFPVHVNELAFEFIGKKWSIGGDVSLVDFKSSVSIIFEIYLSTLTDGWFEILQNDLLPEMIEVSKKEKSVSLDELKYKCLNRNTLFGFFKLVLDFIIKKCKSLTKTTAGGRNSLEMLQSWAKPILVARSLTKVVANNDDGNTMFSFIKFSRDLMNMIIRNLMPILDNMLRHENEEVIQLLKYIQDVTRFIQRVCLHCKGKKNLPVTSMVPQVRRYLETFMYRVKKMMCINKCVGGSLNILPLANKDLHGNRIESSQEADSDDHKSDSGDNDDNDGDDDNESVCEGSDNETVLEQGM